MISLLVALLGVGVLGAAFSHRYAWWRPTIDHRHPRILMYHMIRDAVPGGRYNKLRVAPAMFDRQLAHLVEDGWNFAFLSDLAEPVPPKTVVLTFDDGFRDNYLAAHPLLEKHGAKATLFLVVDRFERDWSRQKNARHDSGELMAEPKLADAEVDTLLASGRWELGAHTHTHAFLPSLTPSEREEEIAGGKAALEGTFGVPVTSFAYPFGVFDDADVAAARAAEYRFAVTTNSGVSAIGGIGQEDPLLLKRINVSGKDGMFAFRQRLRTGTRGL